MEIKETVEIQEMTEPDLEEVLQTIVREAAGIAGAPFVRLFLLDEAARLFDPLTE